MLNEIAWMVSLVLAIAPRIVAGQSTTMPPAPSTGRRVDIGGGQHLYLNCTGKAPYILVGQSYGGLVVRGFARRYARDVQGMVLVDPVHEDQQIEWGGEAHRLRDAARGRIAPTPHIALDTELLRMAPDSSAMNVGDTLPPPLDHLPVEAQRLWKWAAAQPLYRMAWAAEMDWSPEELARMHTERARNRASLGSMPLVVLARTRSAPADTLERERQALMADLAALSRRGRLEYAQASGHNIHIEDPELVVRAIRECLRMSTGSDRGVTPSSSTRPGARR